MSSWKGAILKGFQTLLQQNHQKVFNSNKIIAKLTQKILSDEN